MNDIQRAYKALVSKLGSYNTLFEYADGQQPLVYSSNKLKATFKNINARFQQNWIAVVIDSTLDRLLFKGWNVDNQEQSDLLNNLFGSCQIAIEADDSHKGALITHESFIIAWKEGDGIQVYYNDPRMVHVFYKADNPKEKEFAAKWFITDDQKYHITLYYPERLEYWVTKDPVKQGSPKSEKEFIQDDPPFADNPFGIIPVFHFRTDRRGLNSEITNIVTLQDAINKLLADMMIAAEFGAFKQRWIITNSDTKGLVNAPNEIWTIPASDGTGNTSVGEFSETNLKNFLEAMDKIANSIAIISRTPKHYFVSTGSNISGEALMAMESPLIAKVERYQKNFGVTWIELGSFLGKLSGVDIPTDQIKLVWEPAQSVQPLTEAQTIKTNVEAGVPLESSLRWSGKNEYEIQTIMKEVAKETKDKLTFAKAQLEKLRLETEQSNQQPDGSGTDRDENEMIQDEGE